MTIPNRSLAMPSHGSIQGGLALLIVEAIFARGFRLYSACMTFIDISGEL